MSSTKNIPSWSWIVAVAFVAILAFNCVRSHFKQDIDTHVHQYLQQEYGQSVRQYRADPVGFRARVQQQVQRGELTQQQADQIMVMMENLSRKLP